MFHRLKITTDKDGMTKLLLDSVPMSKGGLRFSPEQNKKIPPTTGRYSGI